MPPPHKTNFISFDSKDRYSHIVLLDKYFTAYVS